MEFARPLLRATLLRRYKRFLADVTLEDGTKATAHCANPGAMTGLAEPGATVWLEPNDDPARKLKLSWKLVELPGGHLAGIDTGLPNKVVGEALRAGAVEEVANYRGVRAEVKYGERSRVDFLLLQEGLADVYLEVKNAHLCRDPGLAEFPDTVTARGSRHLEELSRMVAAGHRAVILYLVQRDDCDRFALAADIDPSYAAASRAARDAGVEVLCYRAVLTREGVTLGRRLPLADEG